MSTVVTNLRVLKRSRVRPAAGDVFAMGLPNGTYLFGLVAFDHVPRERAPMPNANLLYVYRETVASLEPPLDALTPDRLLLPPVWTNDLGWTRGYFQNVAHVDDLQSRLLRQHCFWHVPRKRYVDENGDPIAARVEPCGEYGLISYRWIDDHVSDALGIPRAPLDA
jgi:hypothetical protein